MTVYSFLLFESSGPGPHYQLSAQLCLFVAISVAFRKTKS